MSIIVQKSDIYWKNRAYSKIRYPVLNNPRGFQEWHVKNTFTRGVRKAAWDLVFYGEWKNDGYAPIKRDALNRDGRQSRRTVVTTKQAQIGFTNF